MPQARATRPQTLPTFGQNLPNQVIHVTVNQRPTRDKSVAVRKILVFRPDRDNLNPGAASAHAGFHTQGAMNLTQRYDGEVLRPSVQSYDTQTISSIGEADVPPRELETDGNTSAFTQLDE